MRERLFYIFITVWFISFFVTNPFNLINLFVLGIFLKLILEKRNKGIFPLWTLIVAIGIVGCNILIGLGMILRIVRP